MSRIRHGTKRRITAIFTALLLMVLWAATALAASSDWVRLKLEVVWTHADGSTESFQCAPIPEMPCSFWVRVPEEALESLKVRVSHPSHAYFYIPESGSPLDEIIPAGETPDGKTFKMIQAIEGGTLEAFYLYISTTAEEPVIPTPTPSPSSTPEPTPTPSPTPEPTEEPTPSPTPEPTAEPTPTPTPEPTPTPSPTPTPTAEPTPTPTPEPVWMEAMEWPTDELINRYGRTIRNDVRFRQGTGTGTRLLEELKKGSYVYVIRNVLNEEEQIWSEVEVNGERGFIMSQYLNVFATQEKSDEYAATLNSPAKPYTWEELAEAEATETPTPETPVPETPVPETPMPETEAPAAETPEEMDELETVTVEEPVEPTPGEETETAPETETAKPEPETEPAEVIHL